MARSRAPSRLLSSGAESSFSISSTVMALGRRLFCFGVRMSSMGLLSMSPRLFIQRWKERSVAILRAMVAEEYWSWLRCPRKARITLMSACTMAPVMVAGPTVARTSGPPEVSGAGGWSRRWSASVSRGRDTLMLSSSARNSAYWRRSTA